MIGFLPGQLRAQRVPGARLGLLAALLDEDRAWPAPTPDRGEP